MSIQQALDKIAALDEPEEQLRAIEHLAASLSRGAASEAELDELERILASVEAMIRQRSNPN